jgi:hypothetical protein
MYLFLTKLQTFFNYASFFVYFFIQIIFTIFVPIFNQNQKSINERI